MKDFLRWASGIAFAVVVYINGARFLAPWISLPVSSTVALTLATVVFSVLHAAWLLGSRGAGVFFAVSAAVSWAFEELGVVTGLIYGRYHYTDLLGPKLGHVPLLIPLAWFAMIYPSYLIAAVLTEGRLRPRRWGVGPLVWRAVLAGLVMTAWDVVIDPGMALPGGSWVWEEGGPYFGVPLQNFAGWLLTTGVVYLLFGLWDRRQVGRARAKAGEPAAPPLGLGALPLLMYALMALRYVVTNDRGILGVVALFAMGVPVLVALGRLLDPPPAVPGG